MGFSNWVASLRGMLPGNGYKYSAIPVPLAPLSEEPPVDIWSRQNRRLLKLSLGGMLLIIFFYLVVVFRRVASCETAGGCSQAVSHLWGQYSPYFPVPSEFNPRIPQECDVNFVQVLSRHGARDPTASKTAAYKATVERIHSSVATYGKGYEFIRDYSYTLGADELTIFGQLQMMNSGSAFFHRYRKLAGSSQPFIRASGQNRVVESALNWTEGFYGAKIADGKGKGEYYSGGIVIIPETTGSNNSLNHGLCTSFEEGPFAHVGDDAQVAWAAEFTKPITERLNENLAGANLSTQETIHLMDLCPFNTVADPRGRESPFCQLFSTDEWKSYDYYQSLGKYYGFNNGNPLGPTQGVGFVNELIARLTGKPVVDSTTTNSTLDSSADTFPLDKAIYADFSHDNDMTSVYGALGLYNATTPLPKMSRVSPKDSAGYSASWTVPFAGRMVVEKMRCAGLDEELVRILVNDRVVPLRSCAADSWGRCTLDAFVRSLSFARGGGLWDRCFA